MNDDMPLEVPPVDAAPADATHADAPRSDPPEGVPPPAAAKGRRRRPSRPRTPPPSHGEWDVLQALYIPGQTIDILSHGDTIIGRLLRGGLLPYAQPVTAHAFESLQRRGWLARLREGGGKRPGGLVRVRYRLSLRGRFAVCRLRGDFAAVEALKRQTEVATKPAPAPPAENSTRLTEPPPSPHTAYSPTLSEADRRQGVDDRPGDEREGGGHGERDDSGCGGGDGHPG